MTDNDEQADNSDGSADDAEPDAQDAEGMTGEDVNAATDSVAGSVLAWVTNMPREDWLIVFLLLAFLLPFGYVYADSQGWLGASESVADPELVAYCEDVADAVQGNASIQGTTCDCVLPGEFDESQFSSDVEEVDEATDLFLIDCELPNDQNIIYPIRVVRDESVDLNDTVPNGSAPGNGTAVLQ